MIAYTSRPFNKYILNTERKVFNYLWLFCVEFTFKKEYISSSWQTLHNIKIILQNMPWNVLKCSCGDIGYQHFPRGAYPRPPRIMVSIHWYITSYAHMFCGEDVYYKLWNMLLNPFSLQNNTQLIKQVMVFSSQIDKPLCSKICYLLKVVIYIKF